MQLLRERYSNIQSFPVLICAHTVFSPLCTLSFTRIVLTLTTYNCLEHCINVIINYVTNGLFEPHA